MHDIQLREFERSPLGQLLELYLEAKEASGCSPRTIDHYRREVTAFVKWLHEDKPNCKPEDVQTQDIRRWIIKRRHDGISTHTLHDSYRNPKIFWNWLIREELTDNNPFLKVDPPKKDKVMKPDLSLEEVQRLFAACEGRDYKMIRDKALLGVLLDTGLRIHEAANLKVGDIQEDTLIIRGKGGKHRYVFLSPEVRISLKRYLRVCPCELEVDDPLWVGHQGQYTANGLQQVVIDIGKRAGINPLGPHRLRRTFATWSLRSGCDIETLRRLMGHSSLTVLQGYLALVETDLKKAHSNHSPMNIVAMEDKKRQKNMHQQLTVRSARNNFPSNRKRRQQMK